MISTTTVECDAVQQIRNLKESGNNFVQVMTEYHSKCVKNVSLLIRFRETTFIPIEHCRKKKIER